MDPLFSYFIMMTILAIAFNIPVLYLVLKKQLFTYPFGVLVAAILGIFFFVINPFFWLALLFFSLSSSLLTRVKANEKTKVILDFEKGSSQRDANQVLANGFVPALFVIGYALYKLIPNLVEPRFISGAYVSCTGALLRFMVIESRLSVTIKDHLFFRRGSEYHD